MNMYGPYSPGDKWKPTAAWLNAVNDMLRRFGGRTGGLGMSIPANGVQKLPVYNAGSSALVAGQAVGFVSSGASVVGGSIPCSALGDTGKRWGVLLSYLAPKQGGTCVIAGPVKAERITGSGGERALPVTGNGAIVSGTQVWSCGDTGMPLYGGGSAGGIVVLGATTAPGEGYSSYFKVTVEPSVSGAAVVTVADGATGSNSIAVVNGGSTYSLPPYTETVSGGALYLLKYTPAQFGSGGAIVSSATMVISSIHQSGGDFPTLPSGGTSGAYYYQLGRVISSGGALSAVQDHTAGVVQFQWYANCFLG